ncbi:hypothetical protein GN958_ATG20131 [Phytophthora infestans]|uniref:Uncharacterized protein n=1 Tax=Phytophthora infestans TaxID=4787 RepID=A0A8S9TUJ8_PHYIN|nr:hypothetical protein GN958_ATG20131 [Phytophthora infestans]
MKFANHFVSIAPTPHAAVMVVNPKDKSSSSTTPASKDRKKNRAKSERGPATDKKPVRIPPPRVKPAEPSSIALSSKLSMYHTE